MDGNGAMVPMVQWLVPWQQAKVKIFYYSSLSPLISPLSNQKNKKRGWASASERGRCERVRARASAGAGAGAGFRGHKGQGERDRVSESGPGRTGPGELRHDATCSVNARTHE
jgi:hypothetical protein